jgi:hypothetical protein
MRCCDVAARLLLDLEGSRRLGDLARLPSRLHQLLKTVVVLPDAGG